MIYLVILAVLVVISIITNNKIRSGNTAGLYPYGFALGLTGSLVAVIFIASWLIKKITKEEDRKTFHKGTIHGLLLSLAIIILLYVLFGRNSTSALNY